MEKTELLSKIVSFLSYPLSDHISISLDHVVIYGANIIEFDNNNGIDDISIIKFYPRHGIGHNEKSAVSTFTMANNSLRLHYQRGVFSFTLSKDQWLNHYLFGRKVKSNCVDGSIVFNYERDDYSVDGLSNRMIYDSIDVLSELGRDISLFSVLDMINIDICGTYSFASRYNRVFSYWSILHHFGEYVYGQS